MNKKAVMADAKKPIIKAVLDQAYRLPTLKDAEEKLTQFKEQFICSKEQTESDALRLWIRGFAVTTPQKKKGFLGHYAFIRIRKLSAGHYTLIAERDEVELKYHPQKRRPKQLHPDFGHPVLRAINKKLTYKNMEDAQKQLEKLHIDFPKTSIPNAGKLYIIVYSQNTNGAGRTQKYILSIRSNENEEFMIDMRKNTPRGKNFKRNAVKTEAKGQFTSQVIMQRKRRA